MLIERREARWCKKHTENRGSDSVKVIKVESMCNWEVRTQFARWVRVHANLTRVCILFLSSCRHEIMLDTCFHHVTGGEGRQLQCKSCSVFTLRQHLVSAHSSLLLTVILSQQEIHEVVTHASESMMHASTSIWAVWRWFWCKSVLWGSNLHHTFTENTYGVNTPLAGNQIPSSLCKSQA